MSEIDYPKHYQGGFEELFEELFEEIVKNNKKILNEFSKAYLAQLYQEGEKIKPGDYILVEKHLDNRGGFVTGKQYWFEKKEKKKLSIIEKFSENEIKTLELALELTEGLLSVLEYTNETLGLNHAEHQENVKSIKDIILNRGP
jgi:hypothetical protein